MQAILVFFATVALAVAAESNLLNAERVSVVHKTRSRFAPRIGNGNAAGVNQFPYQVSVLTPHGEGRYSVCGGALISSTWVLTAAHCTKSTQLNLRIGSINLWDGGVTLTSFQYVVNNGISLVRLPSPVGFSDAIQPAQLPTIAQARATFAGFQAGVTGWGPAAPGENVNISFLRWVFMRVITNADCANAYGPSVLADQWLCGVGFESPNQGSCIGDHGSPLTINEGGMINTIIGVSSFYPNNGCFVGDPSVYARVTVYSSWIASVTGITLRT